ncbi:hypothetical protein [Thermosulfurimonas sp. F29]|uniref:hypothetical protein n=1 Tax=Thermosulfurimonas sp. F29 TaxID=2867247 RepID=UPI001C82DF49|nr:hypothetical protein [Thermosulfurimonas sp. F29]MBX6423647.1 hypothetical protein [Thermosulfurimonas sp. F29]
MKRAFFLLICWMILYTPPVRAFTPQEEKLVMRDLSEIKATLRVFMEQTNKRFEEMYTYMNKRFEEMYTYMNKRFEDINKRFEDINKRFDQLYTFLWIVTGIFTSFTLGVIGFALWDRRTIIRKAREEALDQIIAVLRDLAREDERVANILRKHGLVF